MLQVVCRPLAVSMGNAIKWLKLRIARIKPDEPELAAKEYLLSEIHVSHGRQRV